MSLSDRERALLDFEGSWWMEPGRKDQAIRERFDLSSGRYYSVLNALTERREALEYAPLVVHRLRRRRRDRRAAAFGDVRRPGQG